MNVIVHLHTTLQRITVEGILNQVEVNLPDGSCLLDLLRILDITFEPESLLLVVNGRLAETNQKLFQGDQVNLMPAISGG